MMGYAHLENKSISCFVQCGGALVTCFLHADKLYQIRTLQESFFLRGFQPSPKDAFVKRLTQNRLTGAL